jgi:hypothetical protein
VHRRVVAEPAIVVPWTADDTARLESLIAAVE